jgi:hypothetical protein
MSSSKGKEMKTMKNFNYNLTIINNGNEIVIKTNDVAYAIKEYLRADEAGCEVCLCNGYTGEVLCHNGDEPWCTDEMALMILGYMCAEQWGDEDDEPFCGECGGPVDENGVCQHCGVEDNTLTGGDVVAEIIAKVAKEFGLPS